MSIHKHFLPIFFCLVFAFLSCQNALGADEKKKVRILVYGNGFIFGVKEPEGWQSDTSNASGMHANIIFYKLNETINDAKYLIYIRLNDKTDEHIEKDLEFDMSQYKNRYPSVEFKDINVAHKEYKLCSKLFYVQNSFYEYVTYVNPGTGKPFTFSVAMNVPNNEASKSALKTYKEIINSLILLNP